jgi:hypothetical protein
MMNIVRHDSVKVCDEGCFITRILCTTLSIQDSLVGIEMGFGLDGGGAVHGRGKICLFSIAYRLTLGCIQENLLSNGHRERPERQADHSLNIYKFYR